MTAMALLLLKLHKQRPSSRHRILRTRLNYGDEFTSRERYRARIIDITRRMCFFEKSFSGVLLHEHYQPEDMQDAEVLFR